jgi:hypothetical protein
LIPSQLKKVKWTQAKLFLYEEELKKYGQAFEDQEIK